MSLGFLVYLRTDLLTAAKAEIIEGVTSVRERAFLKR